MKAAALCAAGNGAGGGLSQLPICTGAWSHGQRSL